MSEQEQVYLMILGSLAELPEEEKRKVDHVIEGMEVLAKECGDAAFTMAFALVGARIAKDAVA